jgi:hypothetical protein
MPGLVLDIIFEFLFRILVRLFRVIGATSWPIVRANITAANYTPAGYGCEVAKITYEFRLDGKSYTGMDAKPFLVERSAKDYVERHSPGSELLVRVKPGVPESSVVRNKDQWSLTKGLQLDN